MPLGKLARFLRYSSVRKVYNLFLLYHIIIIYENKNTILFIFILLILVGCKKDSPVTRVVKFTSTTYQTLGTYDSLGKPDYLLTKDSISSTLLSFIRNTLPEGKDLRNSHPELLASSAIGDITITQPSDVFVTFVSQTGGYTNSMAFTLILPLSPRQVLKTYN